MNFVSFGDGSGDIEVMFETRFVVFLNEHGDQDFIKAHFGEDFLLKGISNYLGLLGSDLRNFIESECGPYLSSRVNQALCNAVNAYNGEQARFTTMLLMRQHRNEMIYGSDTMLSWYMSGIDSTHMKLKFG